jgi:hypothetical protein
MFMTSMNMVAVGSHSCSAITTNCLVVTPGAPLRGTLTVPNDFDSPLSEDV